MSRKQHYMSIAALVHGTRYVTCLEVGCSRVRRHWAMKPLIHKGGKP